LAASLQALRTRVQASRDSVIGKVFDMKEGW